MTDFEKAGILTELQVKTVIFQRDTDFPRKCDRVDRDLAEIGDHEAPDQPAASFERARLSPDLDVLGQVPLGKLGEVGARTGSATSGLGSSHSM